MIDVFAARKRLEGVSKHTPLVHSKTFSEWSGNKVFLKLESLQVAGSFKIRGAYNKISKLSKAEKKKGVIAASTGNHAQAIAYSATKLKVKSTIVMPKYAPLAKITATKGYGAKVILHGKVYDDAYEEAKKQAVIVHKEAKKLAIDKQAKKEADKAHKEAKKQAEEDYKEAMSKSQ